MSEIKIDSHRIGVLFSAAEIAAQTTVIASAIAARKPERLLVVPILKGSFVFAADLIRAMHHAGLSPEVDFMILASYRAATKSAGRVEVLRDVESDVRGRDVLLIDDILESGRTLAFAKDLIVPAPRRYQLHQKTVQRHICRITIQARATAALIGAGGKCIFHAPSNPRRD